MFRSLGIVQNTNILAVFLLKWRDPDQFDAAVLSWERDADSRAHLAHAIFVQDHAEKVIKVLTCRNLGIGEIDVYPIMFDTYVTRQGQRIAVGRNSASKQKQQASQAAVETPRWDVIVCHGAVLAAECGGLAAGMGHSCGLGRVGNQRVKPRKRLTSLLNYGMNHAILDRVPSKTIP